MVIGHRWPWPIVIKYNIRVIPGAEDKQLSVGQEKIVRSWKSQKLPFQSIKGHNSITIYDMLDKIKLDMCIADKINV